MSRLTLVKIALTVEGCDSMEANFDVILLHGPPLIGQITVLRERIGPVDSYRYICPDHIFHDNPHFGVRDIANKVVHHLERNEKVIVEDTSLNGAIKDSVIRITGRKVPKCSIHEIQLLPRHGLLQALWSREFLRANIYITKSVPENEIPRLPSDEAIQPWFDECGKCQAQSANSKKADSAPSITREVVHAELIAISNYKFEIPALFIQWEGAQQENEGQILPEISHICHYWSQSNPLGRIIFVCDGHSISKGLNSLVQESSNIVLQLHLLIKKLSVPVFVWQTLCVLENGAFLMPPNPGILAFLQYCHHIDLQHKHTVYLYSDSRHMNMAQTAGVRHLKIIKALSNPQSMSSCYSAVSCPVPEMLKCMQVVPESSHSLPSDNAAASIPLIGLEDRFSGCHICLDYNHSHREYVFATDVQVLRKFQNLYNKHVSMHGVLGPKKDGVAKTDGQITDHKSGCIIPFSRPETMSETLTREVPKWMVRQKPNLTLDTSSTLEKVSSTDSAEGSEQKQKTIYLMTEKELLVMARKVLKQAGGEDLREKKSNLRNIESQNVTTTNIAPAASTVTDIYMEGEEIDVIKPVTDSHLNNKRHYLDELFVKTIHEKKIRKGSAINSDDRNQGFTQESNLSTHIQRQDVDFEDKFTKDKKTPVSVTDKPTTSKAQLSKTVLIDAKQKTKPDLSVLDEIFF